MVFPSMNQHPHMKAPMQMSGNFEEETSKVTGTRLIYLAILFMCETTAFGLLMTLNSSQGVFVSNVRGSAVNPPNCTSRIFVSFLSVLFLPSSHLQTKSSFFSSVKRNGVLYRILSACRDHRSRRYLHIWHPQSHTRIHRLRHLLPHFRRLDHPRRSTPGTSHHAYNSIFSSSSLLSKNSYHLPLQSKSPEKYYCGTGIYENGYCTASMRTIQGLTWTGASIFGLHALFCFVVGAHD